MQLNAIPPHPRIPRRGGVIAKGFFKSEATVERDRRLDVPDHQHRLHTLELRCHGSSEESSHSCGGRITGNPPGGGMAAPRSAARRIRDVETNRWIMGIRKTGMSSSPAGPRLTLNEVPAAAAKSDAT